MLTCAECKHDMLEHADLESNAQFAPCQIYGCPCRNWIGETVKPELWEVRAREYRKVLDLIANWNTSVRPGHADYISRDGIINMAKGALARFSEEV